MCFCNSPGQDQSDQVTQSHSVLSAPLGKSLGKFFGNFTAQHPLLFIGVFAGAIRKQQVVKATDISLNSR